MVTVDAGVVAVDLGDRTGRFHAVWLRDNCWCDDCRITQTAERRLFTPDIPDDLSVVAAEPVPGGIAISWSDGHSTTFSSEWLVAHDYSADARKRRIHEPVLWTATFTVPRFAHDAVVGTGEGQRAYLDAIRDFGVAIVTGVPSIDGEVERFAETLGHVREVAFERVHNVMHDPTGYNVAHTNLGLKPHADFPSYHWPPSIQLLHFLVNQAEGGESIVVDGWKVVDDLRRDDPEAFEVLTRCPVPYQLFSATEDTYATAPMIQLDSAGKVAMIRFSSQLAQPLDLPFEDVEAFYAAYRKLGRLMDAEQYRNTFKTGNGDLLTVHGHRVLHGRLGFVVGSGARHLQDVYMEFDDLMARRRVLLGIHEPMSATIGAGR
jgi:alpha-ketoglutarate-dependent taurine dioxygenase